jgi:hypothetical protein
MILLAGDTISFVMQAAAGILLTKSGMTDTGNTLIPAGSASSCSGLSFQHRVRVRRVKLS